MTAVPVRPLCWTSAVVTDTGLVRSRNEDAARVRADLALVADGLGGHAGGAVASRLTVDTVSRLLPPRGTRTLADVQSAVLAAHAAVRERAEAEPGLRHMGTTLTGLVLLADELAVVNVGDSRCYRVTETGWVRLTRDDSLVADLVDAGQIAADFAPFHPQRHVVTAAVGLPCPTLPMTAHLVEPAAGRYVLCSDGLSDVLDAGSLHPHAAAATGPAASPQEAAETLLELALAGGGPDNVTVAILDVG